MRRLRPLRSLRPFGLKPRQGGERVGYSAEQTERYKSPDIRIAAAQEILSNWDAMVREDPISATVTLYKITSPRSPYGYWTVGVTDSNAVPPPDLPLVPPDEGGGGGGGGTRFTVIYVGHVGPTGDSGTLLPGRPPGLSFGVAIQSQNGIPFPVPTNETYPGSLVISPTGGGLLIYSPIDLSGVSLNQARANDQTIFLGSRRFYLLDGQPYDLVLFRRWSGPGVDPAQCGPIIRNFGAPPPDPWYAVSNLDFPSGLADPLVMSANPFYSEIATPLNPYTPGGGGGGNGDPASQDPTPPPQLPLPPGEPPGPGAFSCDCPDYTRYEPIDPDSPYPSRWVNREWVESKAGCVIGPTGIGCKHTIAVALKLGIPLGY